MPSPSLQTSVNAVAGRVAVLAPDTGKAASCPDFGPGTPAARALAQLLLVQFEIIERAEHGIRADHGAAVLHEFRVACRRSRTLVTRVKKVLPAVELRRFKSAFAWLSDVTGPCRDLDVFLRYLGHTAVADGDAGAGLEQLRDMLRNDKRLARARMLRALRSKRYQRFKSDWHALLERAAAGELEAAKATAPVKNVSNASLWRSYRRILKTGKVIKLQATRLDANETAAVHELRKEGKKLRYLLEAFGSLYPQDKISGAIKALKKLQDILGGVVDAEVQALTLQQLATRLDPQVNAPALRTVHMLLNDCDQREQACLEKFSRRFEQFTSKSRKKSFKQLFKPGKD